MRAWRRRRRWRIGARASERNWWDVWTEMMVSYTSSSVLTCVPEQPYQDKMMAPSFHMDALAIQAYGQDFRGDLGGKHIIGIFVGDVDVAQKKAKAPRRR